MALQNRRANKRIPFYFVAFFVVLAMLNAVFFYIAITTHRGVVIDNAYEKGLKYNQVIERFDRQEKLGWQGNITFNEGDNILKFQLMDKKNAPIDGAVVRAHLTFIAKQGYDFDIPLMPSDITGIYEAPLTFPIRGQWNIHIHAQHSMANYQAKKWVVVRQ